MKLPQDWFDAAVTITPGFEVAGDPYLGVSGDFDGMGISCGALQWNIGKQSLQPMLQAVGETVVRNAMPVFGAAMWSASNTSIAQGLAIVRGWQNGTKLQPKPKAELRALMGSQPMRQEQIRAIGKVADRALKAANTWAVKRTGGTASKRSFCWFFDLTTQNGGLNGLTTNILDAFIQNHAPDRVDDFICDFLATRSGNSGHEADARKNADLWRGTADSEKLDLLCMSFLRSQSALVKWRHVVLNRKGAIALGKGWVNSGLKDFRNLGL